MPLSLLHCRLSWALVHSREPADVQRGIELAEALTDSGGLEQRDLLYLVAVSGGCLCHIYALIRALH